MTEQTPQDPWERYGWVMSAIWLVFLLFPALAALQADLPWPVTAAVLLLLVAFAAVYLHLFITLGAAFQRDRVVRHGLTHLGALAAMGLLLVPVIGPGAMAALPFLVAGAMFTLPLRGMLAVWVVALATAVSVAMLDETNEQWWAAPVVGIVGVSTGLVRLLDERSAERDAIAAQLAIAAERDRVARDVHDVLGHSLTVVTVKAELAGKLLDRDPERARAELADIQSLSRQALSEIRATVGGLRVARLADEVDAARSALTGAGIEARLPQDPQVVDPRHRIVLAWSLREVVTNVVRHSGATTCTVDLEDSRLVVTDDGVGMSGHSEGNGLRGLRERLAGVGGSVQVGPGPQGAGTQVEVWV